MSRPHVKRKKKLKSPRQFLSKAPDLSEINVLVER